MNNPNVEFCDRKNYFHSFSISYVVVWELTLQRYIEFSNLSSLSLCLCGFVHVCAWQSYVYVTLQRNSLSPYAPRTWYPVPSRLNSQRPAWVRSVNTCTCTKDIKSNNIVKIFFEKQLDQVCKFKFFFFCKCILHAISTASNAFKCISTVSHMHSSKHSFCTFSVHMC